MSHIHLQGTRTYHWSPSVTVGQPVALRRLSQAPLGGMELVRRPSTRDRWVLMLAGHAEMIGPVRSAKPWMFVAEVADQKTMSAEEVLDAGYHCCVVLAAGVVIERTDSVARAPVPALVGIGDRNSWSVARLGSHCCGCHSSKEVVGLDSAEILRF